MNDPPAMHKIANAQPMMITNEGHDESGKSLKKYEMNKL